MRGYELGKEGQQPQQHSPRNGICDYETARSSVQQIRAKKGLGHGVHACETPEKRKINYTPG